MGPAHRTSRRIAGVIAALALGAVMLVATGTTSAGAAGPVPALCDTRGAMTVTPDDAGGVDWDLHLEGVCATTLGGSTIATVDGLGTSAGAGLCDGSVLVQDLVLDVRVTERNVVTGRTVTTDQTWTIPISAYPVATPFLIEGEAAGLGSLVSRLFLQCGESGSANTWAEFVFTS